MSLSKYRALWFLITDLVPLSINSCAYAKSYFCGRSISKVG